MFGTPRAVEPVGCLALPGQWSQSGVWHSQGSLDELEQTPVAVTAPTFEQIICWGGGGGGGGGM